MSSVREFLITSAIVLGMLAIAFFAGRLTAPPSEKIIEHSERIDTILLRDTIIKEKPIAKRIYIRDTIRLQVTDTIFIDLPREVKVYEDSLYRAEVSGYMPSLDRIDIYTQTQVVTKDVTQVVKQKTRWGLGLSAGYGVTINTTDQTFKPAPYIGVGIHYNLISW